MPDDTRPTADTAPPEQARLWFALFNEVGIIGQLSRTMLEGHLPKGLITAHFTVLNHLTGLGDGRTPLLMAQAFQIPKTSMTHTLATLEQRELIVHRPNPKDGRSKLVFLTDEGRAAHGAAIAALSPDIAHFATLFPTEKVAQLVPALQELREILDNNRPD